MEEAAQRLMLARSLRHLPAVSLGTVLLSIKPKYAQLIAEGAKRVEFRRRFPTRLTAARALFYVSSPVRALALEAQIVRVHRGEPRELWREFGAQSGASKREFDDYFAGIRGGMALVLVDVRRFKPVIALDDPRLRAHGFRPPQSLEVLDEASPLLALINSSADLRCGKDLPLS